MGGDADPYDVAYFANFLQQQQIAPVKVGWYSGKQELPDGFPIRNFQYIKLGPYVESRGGLKSEQTNQRLYKIVQGEMNDITYRFRTKTLLRTGGITFKTEIPLSGSVYSNRSRPSRG